MAIKRTKAGSSDGIFPPNATMRQHHAAQPGADDPFGPETVIWHQVILFDKIPEVVLATDRRGIVSYWNPPAERLFGQSAWKALGSPIGRLFRGCVAKSVLTEISKALQRDGSYSGAVNCATQSGRVLRLDVHARLIHDKPGQSAPAKWADAAETIQGAIVSVRDMTAVHEAEQVLITSRSQLEQQAAQLSQKNDGLRRENDELRQEIAQLRQENGRLRHDDARKRHFLNVISHELRNPLAVITIAQGRLRRVLADSDAAQRGLALIERQTHVLTRLVDDLLDMSRLNTKKMNLKPVSLELNALVGSIIDDHRMQFVEKGVVLEADIADSAIVLQADPIRLSQVFDNILHNALKFTEKDGRVNVRTQLVEAPSQVEAMVMISDTGIGIEPGKLNKLFFPFLQVASTEQRDLDNGGHTDDDDGPIDYGGLGLGLSIAKGLVALHGGYIEVESDGLGCGTRFTVHLPVKPHD